MSETWPHWHLGSDNSGDVMVWENVVGLRGCVKKEMGEVHLVSYGAVLLRRWLCSLSLSLSLCPSLSLSLSLCVSLSDSYTHNTHTHFPPTHTLPQVTADGSINLSDSRVDHEGAVAQLIYCEAVAALLLLRVGGSLVLKTYSTLECQTLCLVYLLACCFNEVLEILSPTFLQRCYVYFV